MASGVQTKPVEHVSERWERLASEPGPLHVGSAPDGVDALALAHMARGRGRQDGPASLLHIARDDRRMAQLASALAFFDPDLRVLTLPAWDCVPYDRVSPDPEIVAKRITTLVRLSGQKSGGNAARTIVLTTVNAALQRVPPREHMRRGAVKLVAGGRADRNALIKRLDSHGFVRASTVMEPGEYAVRGGIIDLFAPGHSRPARLDFFGDTIETIRNFDPATQRTEGSRKQLVLLPMSEVPSGEHVSRRFRKRYVELFGPVTGDDPLYEAVSAGQRYPGIEHWLPLFHDKLETIFDYLPGAVVSLDHLAEDAVNQRIEQINDHYDARVSALEQKAFGAARYQPVPPELMFLDRGHWDGELAVRATRVIAPYSAPETQDGVPVIELEGKGGRNFTPERARNAEGLFDEVTSHIRGLQKAGKRVIVAGWSRGSRERLGELLSTHGLELRANADSYPEAQALPPKYAALAVLGLETGFEMPGLAVIAEQDILGDRLIRRRKQRKGSEVLSEAASLTPGDLVVHSDHGIGRFIGLKSIDAAGAPHDCLELEYHGGDKLFLPVENIELLSRYGSDEAGVALDRLGSGAWQARKARLKKRVLEMAGQLIEVAAQRATRSAAVMTPPEGLYEEFCARFGFDETEDQQASIDAVMDDLGKGSPMDRLICGDVGFGKTEVALRAALTAVMSGKQVAVVVPTTLLARQHYKTFTERFAGLPVRVAQASRLVSGKEMSQVRADLKSGQIDIVIGTHALLSKNVSFKDLGLLIVDEEQHFGVRHKERLKELKSDVHVLTLTATPIPRTMQLALTGVREMSIIATPPVDRLAVRTFVTPFDPLVLREALLRERYRGGQTFYVCPRISDLEEVAGFLREHVPELKFQIAHGQMSATQLEDVMSAFYDRKIDVLVCTTIVESGLDVPSANTLIVHRADMFGLSQLYQLRGRVGRSKTRAYAMLTIPANGKLTAGAEKRLKVLHSLDTLGAGFSLASHDLDIRGAGNLLGDEQSGHIRDVGFELYQSMLEEAVAQLREGDTAVDTGEQWSPQISLGMAVLIPEHYVPDLQVRLGLYRRLANLTEQGEIDAFAAELADRFGPLPDEVKQLLEVVKLKELCRAAGIATLEAGPKGAVVGFRGNSFADPAGLINFINANSARTKLQADHKLVYKAEWEDVEDRLKGARWLARELASLAGQAKEAA